MHILRLLFKNVEMTMQYVPLREVLHVTFASAIGQFDVELKAALAKHEAAYYEGLRTHFEKHLSLLKE